jgi:hypothetical protein
MIPAGDGGGERTVYFTGGLFYLLRRLTATCGCCVLLTANRRCWVGVGRPHCGLDAPYAATFSIIIVLVLCGTVYAFCRRCVPVLMYYISQTGNVAAPCAFAANNDSLPDLVCHTCSVVPYAVPVRLPYSPSSVKWCVFLLPSFSYSLRRYTTYLFIHVW